MADTLTTDNGDTFTVPSGEQYEYLNADVNGSLEVNGSLVLKTGYDESTQPSDGGEAGPTEGISTGPVDLPTGSISFEAMETSVAFLIVGLVAVLGAAAAVLRNYVAGVLLSMGVIALILAGVFDLQVEVFYAFIVGTCLMIAAGMAVQWSGA